MHSAKGAGSNEVAKTGWGEWNARCHRCKVTGWLRDSPVGVMDSRPSVCREKSKGNAWMAADGLYHTWPVAAITVVAVARSCSHEEGSLSRWARRPCVTHAKACGKRSQEKKREGQSCDSSQKHAVDLDSDFGPMALRSKGFSIKISATAPMPPGCCFHSPAAPGRLSAHQASTFSPVTCEGFCLSRFRRPNPLTTA
jgi:hypothetical protein